ncbi:MAG: hypothetical protein FJ411_01080 [Verrucomicrobia bacterium]|nr:hypothetical protein [Verrucomicrobiota bacterium]
MAKRWLPPLAAAGLLGLLIWILNPPQPEISSEETTSKNGESSARFVGEPRATSSQSTSRKSQTPPVADLETGAGKEIPGEKILIFRDEAAYRRFLSSMPGGDLLGKIDRLRAIRIRDGDWLRSQIQNSGTVQAPNYYIEAPRVPLDFKEKGDALYEGVGAKSLELMGAGEVAGDWGKAVVVAVMDTGLSAPTAGGMDEGHGTAMASLIGGASRPARGAAPGAKLLDFPVLGKDGIGDAFSLAEAIFEAVDQGARVINMSLGSSGDSAVVREAVAYALSKKVALVAAAGNESVNRVNYPAAYEGVVAVASVDASRQHLYFSNRGPQVAVAAPGYEVVAAWPGQKYVEVSGTSGATALVSGVIAALLAKEPGLTGAQAAQLIAEYADDIGGPGRDEETGRGLVNLQRVLERNERGIVDVAVAGVTLQEEGSLGRVTAGIQNRGTETVNSPILEITIGNERRKFYFGSLAPGQTAAESLRFDLKQAQREGGIGAGAAASVRGDQRGGNDLWSGYFRISKEK